MTETTIKNNIMKALRKEGLGYLWRAGVSAYSKSGVPDILGVVNGKFVGIEVKTPTAIRKPRRGLTENQCQFLQSLEKNGAYVTVVCSVEEALKFVSAVADV